MTTLADLLHTPGLPPVIAALGGQVRLVGGAVRDALIGREVHEIDLATPFKPEVVTARLKAGGFRVIPTGLAHGTITVLSGANSFEITTLRHDLETDGRHARVAFTDDWREDAARRDLTFNALYLAPDGSLFDYFDGQADLAAGRVRFIGQPLQRLQEDRLRALRFFRFYAHYGRGEPDPAGLAACQAIAPELPALSGERVRQELLRLLEASRAGTVWGVMVAQGILEPLLPEAHNVARLQAVIALETALGLGGAPRRLVRLAALLPAQRGAVLAVAERLRLANAERDQLLALSAPPCPVEPLASPGELRQAALKLRSAGRLRDLALLAAAQQGLPAAALTPVWGVAAAWETARFPLSGKDLLARGVARGPGIGSLLEELEQWWADQGFTPDHAACLEELERRLKRMGAVTD